MIRERIRKSIVKIIIISLVYNTDRKCYLNGFAFAGIQNQCSYIKKGVGWRVP